MAITSDWGRKYYPLWPSELKYGVGREGCYYFPVADKLAQTWGLKTTYVYCLVIQETGGPGSGCWQELVPLWPRGEGLSSALQRPVTGSASCVTSVVTSRLPLLSASTFFSQVSPRLSLTETPFLGVRPTQMIQDDTLISILNLTTSTKTLYSEKVMS